MTGKTEETGPVDKPQPVEKPQPRSVMRGIGARGLFTRARHPQILRGLNVPPPIAAFRLSKYKDNAHKKVFDPWTFACSRCNRTGHDDSFCPGGDTKQTEEDKIPFVERLLAMPREDPDVLGNLDLKEAMAIIQDRGKVLNEGNPWVESKQRRDKLRARLGFWKAIGTDSTVLSWIAYGKKLDFLREPEHLQFPQHFSYAGHEAVVEKEAESGLGDGSFRAFPPGAIKVVNPLQLERKKGTDKWRVCHNLMHPNSLTAKQRSG